MKKQVKFLVVLGLVLGGIAFLGYGVSADTAELNTVDLSTIPVDENGEYSLEDMLTYALVDEYTAKATYEAIIAAYGEVKPFTNIVVAEQTHIDLLLPLFATYGISIPVNDVVVTELPDSISSALATGIAAEEANIALYQAFLQQDVPADVQVVFEQLITASTHHLNAFTRASLGGAGYDMAYGIGQGLQKMFGYKGTNSNTTRGTGTCWND